MACEILFTTQEASSALCAEELKRLYNPRPLLRRWLRPGVGLACFQDGFPQVSVALADSIFVRHIFPIQATVPLGPGLEDLGPAREFVAASARPNCAVQVRVLDAERYAFHKADLARILAEAAGAPGAPGAPGVSPQPAGGTWVLSVVVCGGVAYCGGSLARENLSPWPGGMRRFAKGPDVLSRAEFKLLEALEVFRLGLPPQGHALDLGAAPGGWTKILLDRGFRVTAVDPAALSSLVAGRPGLVVHRGSVRQFQPKGPYDLLLNDMRMAPRESAEIVAGLAPCLTPGGAALITFKLPPAKAAAALRDGLWVLRRSFPLVRGKQLFHNRSEVTVVAWKEGAGLGMD